MKKVVVQVLASSDYSGAENVVFKIIKELHSAYDFFYCSPRGPIEKKAKTEHIDYLGVKKLKLTELRKIFRVKKPEIIHSHDIKASFLSSLLKGRSKLIIHIHKNDSCYKKICIKTLLFLFCALRADKVLIVSKSIEEEFIFSRLIKKKIICVYNPLDSRGVIKKTRDFKNYKKYDICTVARLAEEKDPMRYAKIIKRLVESGLDLKCVWVGDGPLKSDLESFIQKNNLKKNIDLVGYIDKPYRYVSKSKIFVLTSKYEGFGLAVFEAMALGKPCVVSNVGGLPELVDCECGVLCNTDDDFIVGVDRLLNDIAMRERMSIASRHRAHKLDNYNYYMRRIMDTYG